MLKLKKREVKNMNLELEKITSGPSLAKGTAEGSGDGKGGWTSKCSG